MGLTLEQKFGMHEKSELEEIAKKKKKKKKLTNKDGLRASETTSRILTFTLRRPRGRKKGKGAENIFEEITAENFPNL